MTNLTANEKTFFNRNIEWGLELSLKVGNPARDLTVRGVHTPFDKNNGKRFEVAQFNLYWTSEGPLKKLFALHHKNYETILFPLMLNIDTISEKLTNLSKEFDPLKKHFTSITFYIFEDEQELRNWAFYENEHNPRYIANRIAW